MATAERLSVEAPRGQANKGEMNMNTELDPSGTIVTPEDVDAALKFILDPRNGRGVQDKVQLLADTLKAYMDYAQDREMLEELALFVQRKTQHNPNATGKDVELLGRLQKRFPWLMASGSVPRGQ